MLSTPVHASWSYVGDEDRRDQRSRQTVLLQ
jgi:hypothetical protein